MPATWETYFRSSYVDFYCINGHLQAFSVQPTEAQCLQKQLDAERLARQRAEQRVAERDDAVNKAREEAQHERNRANGYKGHATRITKRAKAGVCPCCNRHFTALERHMASKHPDFTPLEVAA
jgi:regulator of protease activity HflC (stomatin/prohibitin superfamily)